MGEYALAPRLKIELVTIFPRMFDGPLGESMIKRAVEQKLVQVEAIDLRLFAEGRHRQVDDEPYGGGRGMIFKPEPLFKAVENLRNRSGHTRPRVILLTPQGRQFNQGLARELAQENHLILLCGRYEGVDERVRTGLVDDEISIGDYVLTGGEIPALVLTDAVVRLVPGFLEEETLVEESYAAQLLEYPHYTRPPEYRGMRVPSVLLSGDHGRIALWRRQQQLERTRKRRPDLLKKAELSPADQRYLDSLDSLNDQ